MRKSIFIIQMLIQSITRKALWIILIVFGILVTLGCYYYVYNYEPFLSMQMTAYGQIVLTMVFMMMGIELKREQRRENIDDIVTVYSKNSWQFPLGQVLAIGFLALIVTLIISAGCLIRMMIDNAPFLWIEQTLGYVTLLYFLPCWILGLWGLLIAQWSKGKSVYLSAIIIWILTSTLCAEFKNYTDAMGLGRIDLLVNVFNLGMNSFHIIGNVVSGTPIEFPRWIVRIGIMTILIALFLSDNARIFASTRSIKRINWIAMALTIFCGIGLMTYFNQRYAVFFSRFADPEAIQDYVWNKDDKYQPGLPVSLVDFPTEKIITINSEDIDLACTTEGIKAKATIYATMNADSSGQSFTLFSDLIMDNVWVDGIQADFQRSNDGLMIYFPTNKKEGEPTQFIFNYHGYSLPNYPANETTVQLYRSFPWLPWPGIKTTTIYGNFYSYDQSEDFFIEDWQCDDEIEYRLQYQGPGNIYTNLENHGDNVFEGVSSTGVSLYSGMVYYRYRNVDIYIPASQYQGAYIAADALLDAYDPLLNLCDRMGTIKRPERPKSIVVIQMHEPVINGLVIPQELYSRGTEWEIRQYSDTSTTIITRKKFLNSLVDYQKSPDIMAQMAVVYLLNPCTGYPINVSHASTRNFVAWLSVYIRLHDCDDSDIDYYKGLLEADYSGTRNEFIFGKLIKEKPLTQEEMIMTDKIIDRMRTGVNFDESFKSLYQHLLNGDSITASDIVSKLLYEGE